MRIDKVQRGLRKLDDFQDKLGMAIYNTLESINPFKVTPITFILLDITILIPKNHHLFI